MPLKISLKFDKEIINHNEIKLKLNDYLFDQNIISDLDLEEEIKYDSIRYYNKEFEAMVLLEENENLETKDVEKLFVKIRIKDQLEKNIINQFIELDKRLDDLSNNIYKKYDINDNININNNSDSELDIAVLTANPLVNIINKNNKKQIKELSSMNDFNSLTNSIYNIIKTSYKIINAEFLPLTINNLEKVIKLKPKIIHLICKSTYIINDINDKNNSNKVEASFNYANLIFEDDEFFNMKAIKKDDLNDIFDEEYIKNTVLIISTQLSEDIYEMVKNFGFQNILVQHTTIANSSFVEDFNYYFYRNIIEHMEHTSIELCNKNAKNMSKNKSVQFCCCFHHHYKKNKKGKTCSLFKNLENELYICKDKDNKNEVIPHFEHLYSSCNMDCKPTNDKYKDLFNFHWKECINNKKEEGSKGTMTVCCCKDAKAVHKKEFTFHNFIEKDNNIKLGCGKDGIPIIKNLENIPNYEIMKVITGRNGIVYEICEELFGSNYDYINIYNIDEKDKLIEKENIYELEELTDIIIEYLKERNKILALEENDNDNNFIQKSKSYKLLSEPLAFNYKSLKSSPNLGKINNNFYFFKKQKLKKNEKLNKNHIDNANCIYFLIIEDDKPKDNIFSELNKVGLKVVFMTNNKLNIENKNKDKIKQIKLEKKNDINYKIKYQYEKINKTIEDFDTFIKDRMRENKDMEKIEINSESDLKCEILYLFHLLKYGFYQEELKEIFENSNYEINKIKIEINNIKKIIKEEIKDDYNDNIEDLMEKKIIKGDIKIYQKMILVILIHI